MITQQSGIGLGIVGDGKGWSGGATRSDGEANQNRQTKEKRPQVFLEISIDKRSLGRITFELFGDLVPQTVENFRALCTGERGVSAVSGKPLHYKGCNFHKITPGKAIQGGDIVKGNGSGGDSIYNQDGDACFDNENFKLKHDRPGLLSMAHKGSEAGKNCSQFFITTQALPRLDGKHVVFGRIIDGLGKISKLESIGSAHGKPMFECLITDCGELESEALKTRKRKFGDDPDKLLDGWEKKESRSKPGLHYYVHAESGLTQFEVPSVRGQEVLTKRWKAAMDDKVQPLPVRAVRAGEVRVFHILKKHKDFFGKPASSWRQKQISWSQKEAKAALEKIRLKLMCVSVGGGQGALQTKFENYARQESDDDVSAKVGGDLGPIVKKTKLFGGGEIVKVAFELEIGDLSEVVSTKEGVHLVGRFE